MHADEINLVPASMPNRFAPLNRFRSWLAHNPTPVPFAISQSTTSLQNARITHYALREQAAMLYFSLIVLIVE